MEGGDLNKKVLLAFAAAIAVPACVSQSPATYTAVSGSKADARMTVYYRAQAFKGHVDYATGMLSVAVARCAAWGYPRAEAYGVSRVTYGVGIHGAVPVEVLTDYQCEQ